ncbi:MAG: condensation domain-containing protein [Pseudonocardia sp.]|nr:condensation domain-containing protein [Pseudonocardia sp.]
MNAPQAALAARLAKLDPASRRRLRERLAQLRPAPHQLALTPGQHRLWGSAGHVVCQAVRLRGRVDPAALEARLASFVQRHEALRTTFYSDGATVRPVVRSALPPRVVRLRCSGLSEAEAVARALSDEPFDLGTGPLLRVGLAEDASADETWLLLAVPNLVFDAWSFELLLDWLALPADPDDAPARPFSAFAADQVLWVDSAEGQAAAAYWTGVVADPPPPVAADRSDVATDRTGRRIAFTLPGARATAVAAAARAEGATPFAGWLALFGAVLADFTGTPDVLVGTFTANRDRPGAAEIVGYLLNVLPLRLRNPVQADLQAWLRVARDQTRGALRHAAYPGELIEGLALQAVFVFENLTPNPRRIQGALVEPVDVDRGAVRYDLTLSVQPGPGEVVCWLDYDQTRYAEATIRCLAERFATRADEVTAP